MECKRILRLNDNRIEIDTENDWIDSIFREPFTCDIIEDSIIEIYLKGDSIRFKGASGYEWREEDVIVGEWIELLYELDRWDD
jgi:hypothetical protein